MAIDFNGASIETTATGYLENLEDWSEELATFMAAQEDLELTDKHWDLIKYLRDEYINNGQNQPNTRNIVKQMSKVWGEKASQKDLFALFPNGGPSKQAGRIAGIPESRRKGGY